MVSWRIGCRFIHCTFERSVTSKEHVLAIPFNSRHRVVAVQIKPTDKPHICQTVVANEPSAGVVYACSKLITLRRVRMSICSVVLCSATTAITVASGTSTVFGNALIFVEWTVIFFPFNGANRHTKIRKRGVNLSFCSLCSLYSINIENVS